jgi:CRISPR-associated protein Csb2
MALVIEQYFLTGRFHATRWNQNPFEDSHGEWPPSPYRLLRTLAARWFEYQRENGGADSVLRDRLLVSLASALPEYHLPANVTHTSSWPGRGLKQYQPMELAKTDKGKGQPFVKRHQTSLVIDRFAMLSPSQPVLWMWPNLNLPQKQEDLLDQLLRRVTYFGRAESLCLMRRAATTLPIPNCSLNGEAGSGSPVLAVNINKPLDMDILLANNEDTALKGRRIPPGTLWMYARRPAASRITPKVQRRTAPSLQLIQFAVGGRVFPREAAWTRITERFRGIALRRIAMELTGNFKARFSDLSAEEKTEFSLMTGKGADGAALGGHQHANFWLLPDESGKPTRLVCYRSEPFSPIEYDALQSASESPIAWEFGNPDWHLRLVPLSPETPLPHDIRARSRIWKTITPYIPSRHVLGRSGKPKAGHSVEQQIATELGNANLPLAEVTVDGDRSVWVKIHTPKARRAQQTNEMKRGYHVSLTFSEAIAGPLALGNSAHFGLGLFVPA